MNIDITYQDTTQRICKYFFYVIWMTNYIIDLLVFQYEYNMDITMTSVVKVVARKLKMLGFELGMVHLNILIYLCNSITLPNARGNSLHTE